MMEQIVGTKLDYAIIIIYFIFVLGFGSVFGRFTRTTKEFFFGGQRFSWWLIAFSCVATTVGSYSFIKYSAAGFRYGMSSTMTYLNDWFMMPLFMLGWLPIIYFSRVSSIPEFFERRFDRQTRVAAVVVLMLYMIGYIGINFYTLGVALNALLGWDIFKAAVFIAVITGIYVTFGGQTAVIMTDLLQGFLLLIAGFALFFLGVHYLGGWGEFWHHLPLAHRLPFSGFNTPEKFPMVGIFWQDAMANSLAFWFMNQGLIMRFLSVKSVREGRKSATFVILLLMPLASIAVANAGWVGKAMVGKGMLPANLDANKIFVLVSDLICRPGVFGFIMAALTAAMMSTVDTLINAVSAVAVNDIWKPFVAPNRSDRYYLVIARGFSVLAAVLGLALVPLFASFKSIYRAHGAFTAAVTPPMVVAIVLGILWKRYTPKAAFATLIFGTIGVFLSIPGKMHFLLKPFSHGVGPEGLIFMRALYGLIVCTAIALIVSFFTKPRKEEEVVGLLVATIRKAKERFKGGELNDREFAPPILLELREGSEPEAQIHLQDLEKIKAKLGDLLYVADKRRWLGGLKSMHIKAGTPAKKPGIILLPAEQIKSARLKTGELVRVEKIM